jgi:hypothetical protein
MALAGMQTNCYVNSNLGSQLLAKAEDESTLILRFFAESL